MRLNKSVVIVVGALVVVLMLATYPLAGNQQGGEEVGGKGNAEPGTEEEPNLTPPEDKTLRLTVPSYSPPAAAFRARNGSQRRCCRCGSTPGSSAEKLAEGVPHDLPEEIPQRHV